MVVEIMGNAELVCLSRSFRGRCSDQVWSCKFLLLAAKKGEVKKEPSTTLARSDVPGLEMLSF